MEEQAESPAGVILELSQILEDKADHLRNLARNSKTGNVRPSSVPAKRLLAATGSSRTPSSAITTRDKEYEGREYYLSIFVLATYTVLSHLIFKQLATCM